MPSCNNTSYLGETYIQSEQEQTRANTPHTSPPTSPVPLITSPPQPWHRTANIPIILWAQKGFGQWKYESIRIDNHWSAAQLGRFWEKHLEFESWEFETGQCVHWHPPAMLVSNTRAEFQYNWLVLVVYPDVIFVTSRYPSIQSNPTYSIRCDICLRRHFFTK